MARRRSKKLTDRETIVLEALESFQERNGYPPSIREICEETEISSTSVVSYYLDRLEDKGYIERDNRVSRGIRLLRSAGEAAGTAVRTMTETMRRTLQVPLAGPIAAGVAINIPETGFSLYDAESNIELPASLIPSRIPDDELFALEVRGDSMIDALVDDGDVVILRRVQAAEDGDMVCAWIVPDESTTLKYFFREKDGSVRLQPANPNYEPVMLKDPDSLLVQGKVVLVLRQVES